MKDHDEVNAMNGICEYEYMYLVLQLLYNEEN